MYHYLNEDRENRWRGVDLWGWNTWSGIFAKGLLVSIEMLQLEDLHFVGWQNRFINLEYEHLLSLRPLAHALSFHAYFVMRL